MKKRLINTFILVAVALSVNVSFAQEQITEILKGSLNDAEKLTQAYMEPFGKMFNTSLNGGWYQAARPHKLLGFNVTIVAAVTMAPQTSKTFDVAALNLEKLELVNSQQNIAPTITGESSLPVPELRFKDEPSATFALPNGAGLPAMPVPFVQAGIGLPFSTEITIRMLPSMDLGDYGRFNLWGIGVKNQVKDFIPGLKAIPIDLSVMLGYTKFGYEYDIDASKDQTLFLNASGFTGRILVGKTIPILSVYAGLGYSQAFTRMGVAGNYDLETSSSEALSVNDPITLEFPHKSFSANIGARIRLGVISLHADYTLGDYALFSGGLGISFR